jgi:ABC-type multidrug transport system ATPase subunit
MHIQVEAVTKTYGSMRALDKVSLDIEPGQVVALLGSNGAGKTTLLRCLSGIAAPTKGRFFYDKVEFHRDRMDLRRRVGFLPDFPVFFGKMTVVRHLAMVLQLYGVDGGEREKRCLEMLRQFDLLALAELPCGRLSRGQAYKTALAALLAVDPEVLLLDEPFASGMDPHGIAALRTELQAAVKRGHTVIYSTQILDLAERFSDRVCVIHRGEVRAFDTVADLRSRMGGPDGVLEELFRQLREEETP